MTWKPRVVVAAVIEKNGKYLVVEENVDNTRVINQPAGHLEPNETIIEAVKRETLEETGWKFEPTHLVGIMHLLNENTNRIFIRFTFTGKLIEHIPDYQIDPDINAVHWMTYEQIKAQQNMFWRSPLVMRSLDAHRAGIRHPMDILHTMDAAGASCLGENELLSVSPAA
ncbi:MAG: Nudix-like NDP and NTP phosphohydrolase YmfB [uncultured Thiotrichaceae bacterium]|uniref:Phosphatase NudJ n=1 Tax=uncultured Thiotrichaceae bacterium TaxID=298394 RepID=A0A6S6SWT7_9GAMM|nr:MAG: Nudix-like NDP and NTP phosphohydrolase YmfB [uncultured Thiotrichaceae bacterium]